MLNDESDVLVRISDLFLVVPAITGKIELVYEGEQEGAINVAKTACWKSHQSSLQKVLS